MSSDATRLRGLCVAVESRSSMASASSQTWTCRSLVRLSATSGCLSFLRHPVASVRIKVWPQLVRGDSIAKKVSDWNHGLGWRYFDLYVIKPAPDMHLTNLAARDAIPNAARQMGLAASHFDRSKKGLFTHSADNISPLLDCVNKRAFLTAIFFNATFAS